MVKLPHPRQRRILIFGKGALRQQRPSKHQRPHFGDTKLGEPAQDTIVALVNPSQSAHSPRRHRELATYPLEYR